MTRSIEKIINVKLTEHISETEAIQDELDKLQKKLKENKDIKIAQQFMILKDKMLFHKACTLALQDVLDEVNK